jgi:3-methyladenine DNA glycosylase AlkD
MPKRRITPAYIAAHIRRVLKDGGSAPHAEGVQRFFKEEIKSRGWYTAELRKVARRFSHQILAERGREFLVEVADRLFQGRVLEEKIFGVMLLENQTRHFGAGEFRRFEGWIDRVSSWADHDGLVYYLISPLVAADPTLTKALFRWAKSPNRWRRRAACVALIRAAGRKEQFDDITRLAAVVRADEDDMVQKGLGWLLRVTTKADPGRAVPYLMTIRETASRLVLRTACETLPAATRKQVLAR